MCGLRGFLIAGKVGKILPHLTQLFNKNYSVSAANQIKTNNPAKTIVFF